MSYRQRPAQDYETLRAAGAQAVDVRTAAEFANGTAPGAVNIPLDELYVRLNELDRNHCVVLVCDTGGDLASRAAVLLRACFFPNVVVLVGGLRALHNEPPLIAA